MKHVMTANELQEAEQLATAINRLCNEADSDKAVLSAILGCAFEYCRQIHHPPAMLMCNFLVGFFQNGFDEERFWETLHAALAALAEVGVITKELPE